MKQHPIRLGILGGGQLGRMSALAAARLGITTHIYCPDDQCPASMVTNLWTQAHYEDEQQLKMFAADVDVITYEFENIPLQSIEILEAFKPIRPGKTLLEISQNRLKEKDFLNKNDIPTALWMPAHKADDLDVFLDSHKRLSCIVKTARFGYDGKGQLKHNLKNNKLTNWISLNTEDAIVEDIVDFAYEASVIIARDISERTEAFPPTINDHKNHILAKSVSPSPIPENIVANLNAIAVKIADAVQLIGVMAVEFFVTKDDQILVNELAPRTHNSGHWTMDGCNVSQFEQHVRAVCGFPILKPVQHSAVTMVNLIGDDVEKLPEYYKMDNACVHLYGKLEARPGRKMGHVNIVEPLRTSHE